jgi:hypothetical protein
MQWLAQRDVASLVVDLPSLDRADDGGHLAAHREFWGMPPGSVDAGRRRAAMRSSPNSRSFRTPSRTGCTCSTCRCPHSAPTPHRAAPCCTRCTAMHGSRTMRLDREHAHALDAADPLAAWRDRFVLPARAGGRTELVYLCGHSLGAQPMLAVELRRGRLARLAFAGVEGHFSGAPSWMTYHERLAPSRWRTLVGAEPGRSHRDEHADGQPAPDAGQLLPAVRHADARSCSSARLSIRPSRGRIAGPVPRPRSRADLIEVARVQARTCCAPRISSIASSAKARALPRSCCRACSTSPARPSTRGITAAGRRAGCVVGWDLAHAIGNVPVRLHDAGADFAVWCNYKYLNGGPGAVGGAFVHARHARGRDTAALCRLVGHDQATRFHDGRRSSCRARRRRLATQQSADPRAGAGRGIAGALRIGRAAGPAAESRWP